MNFSFYSFDNTYEVMEVQHTLVSFQEAGADVIEYWPLLSLAWPSKCHGFPKLFSSRSRIFFHIAWDPKHV